MTGAPLDRAVSRRQRLRHDLPAKDAPVRFAAVAEAAIQIDLEHLKLQQVQQRRQGIGHAPCLTVRGRCVKAVAFGVDL